MAAPSVSVVLPVRNAEATLGAALRSLAAQTDPDFECLVVDDASTDGSRAVAEQIAGRDPRFRVLRSAGGIVPALNVGVGAARGGLVARMDGDDLAHRERLRLQRAALARDAGLSGVGCHVTLFPRRPLREGRLAYERWLNSMRSADDVARDAFVECPLAHPTWMLRRDALGTAPYRDAGWPEDYDLLLRLVTRGDRLGVVPRRLLGWRDGPARLSRTGSAYAAERFPPCKAHFLARSFLHGVEGYVLWGYGDTGRALARALRAEGRHPSLIVELHAGRVGQRIQGAPVVHRDAAPSFEGRKVVVSVAGAEARADIRARLATRGHVEGRDFVVTA